MNLPAWVGKRRVKGSPLSLDERDDVHYASYKRIGSVFRRRIEQFIKFLAQHCELRERVECFKALYSIQASLRYSGAI